MLYLSPQQLIQKITIEAFSKLVEGEIPPFLVQKCKNEQHGDYAVSLALQLASSAKMNAMDLASAAISNMGDHRCLASASASLPGYINFKMSPEWHYDELMYVDALAEEYGRWRLHEQDSHHLEFGSVNPTGSISVVNGRALVLGDCLARIIQFCGVPCQTHYYVNDGEYGSQANLFVDSILYHYRKSKGETLAFPKNGYQGEGVESLALNLTKDLDREYHGYAAALKEAAILAQRFAQFSEKVTINREEPPTQEQVNANVRKLIINSVVDSQLKTLEALRVGFNYIDRESAIVTFDRLEAVLSKLTETGKVYMSPQREGDVSVEGEDSPKAWLRTSEYGDDHDRCLVREDGSPTYFFSDLAYFAYKAEGYGDLPSEGLGEGIQLLTILGADHDSYVKRLEIGLQLLGLVTAPEFILTQLTSIRRNGETVKRDGNTFPLDDYLKEVGCDAARWYYLKDTPTTHSTIDIEDLTKQDCSNSLFYVQFTYARLSSLLSQATSEGFNVIDDVKFVPLDRLRSDLEFKLIRQLAEFPMTVLRAFFDRSPTIIRAYCESLCKVINQWYETHCAISDDKHLSLARVFLVKQTRQVLANAIQLLGVSHPEHMIAIDAA